MKQGGKAPSQAEAGEVPRGDLSVWEKVVETHNPWPDRGFILMQGVPGLCGGKKAIYPSWLQNQFLQIRPVCKRSALFHV